MAGLFGLLSHKPRDLFDYDWTAGLSQGIMTCMQAEKDRFLLYQTCDGDKSQIPDSSNQFSKVKTAQNNVSKTCEIP